MLVNHRLGVVAVHALALLPAQQSQVETLAVFLYAVGLPAGATLEFFDAFLAGEAEEERGGVGVVVEGGFVALFIMAIDAAAIHIALSTRSIAFTIIFHAFRVLAITALLLILFI